MSDSADNTIHLLLYSQHNASRDTQLNMGEWCLSWLHTEISM